MSVSKTTQRRGGIGRLLRLAKKQPVLRARDVARQGIHTSTLTRMTRSGALEKVGPGRYRLPTGPQTTEHHDLAVATGAVPRSVVASYRRCDSTTSERSFRLKSGLPFRVARECRACRRRRSESSTSPLPCSI